MSGGWQSASGRSVAQTLRATLVPTQAAARKAIHEVGVLFVAELTKTLSTPGRGKPRRPPARVRRQLRSRNAAVRAKGITFQLGNRASRPGDPPAPDTGRLRASAYYRWTGPTSAQVGVATSYAWPLEKGAPRRGLAKRPFMKPTVARVKKLIAARGIKQVTFIKTF